jgi:hypothetical protein
MRIHMFYVGVIVPLHEATSYMYGFEDVKLDFTCLMPSRADGTITDTSPSTATL